LLAEAHAEAGVEAIAARARATLTVDARDALAACPVPVLYLQASRDGVIAARCGREIVRLRPDVELVEIAGPHLALVTNPAAAWSALGAFMARVEG
jgi:pimeloyl-ACP methyl ester carboxylesterase